MSAVYSNNYIISACSDPPHTYFKSHLPGKGLPVSKPKQSRQTSKLEQLLTFPRSPKNLIIHQDLSLRKDQAIRKSPRSKKQWLPTSWTTGKGTNKTIICFPSLSHREKICLIDLFQSIFSPQEPTCLDTEVNITYSKGSTIVKAHSFFLAHAIATVIVQDVIQTQTYSIITITSQAIYSIRTTLLQVRLVRNTFNCMELTPSWLKITTSWNKKTAVWSRKIKNWNKNSNHIFRHTIPVQNTRINLKVRSINWQKQTHNSKNIQRLIRKRKIQAPMISASSPRKK